MPRSFDNSPRIPTGALCLIVGLACLFATLSPAWAGTQVELILDASGSMYNKLDDGRYRITAAKDVLSEFVLNLPDDGLDVGLRIYGSELQPSAPGACEDSKLFVPLEGVDRQALLATLKATRARGKTPIGYSLSEAAKDFTGDACLIVLVTDGEEVCGGDLEASAAKLEQAGCDVDLRIIGFDLSPEAQASFQGIGKFENATDAAGLASALNRAIENVVEVEPLSDATLEAPTTVTAGATFEVKWTAEEGPRDYITIVKAETADGEFGYYRHTSHGSPLQLYAPVETGKYELRYQSDRVEGISARRPVEVTAAEFAIGGPASIKAGQPFEIPWQGPNGPQDYLTLVPAEAPDGTYTSYAYTSKGSPALLHAPLANPGEYEIRYQSDREDGVFARREIIIEPMEVTLDVPAEVTGGKSFEVAWEGPDGRQDYITIIEADAPDGKYASYTYTQKGSPLTLDAPMKAGDYQVRYQSDRENGVFARVDLTVQLMDITLDAPASIAPGSTFDVSWTGPDGKQDYITIVKAGADPGTYLSYRYTRSGPTVGLKAPDEPGSYEVRYQSDRVKGIVFASRPITVQ